MTDPIKLHLPGESFWATPIAGTNHAVVDNCLLTSEFTFGDIIEYDEEGEYVKVVERKYMGLQAQYEGTKENYTKVYEYFESVGIKVEGMVVGRVAMAIPCDMPAQGLIRIVQGCSVPLCVELISDACHE